MAYDSAVFGLGAMLGEGQLLHALSIGRFVGHVVLTPLLLIWAAQCVFRVRMRWAWLLTVVLIAWGAVADLLDLHLIPRQFADTLRYAPEAHSGPPIPALVVSVALLLAGIMLWRRQSWPWLALATAVLFVASGAAFAVPPLGNAGEAVMFAAVVAAARLRHPAQQLT
ncbi:hypothetical protein [Nocardia sp. XZ_19_385]|uniref:hypothetical protein n=1 Tax=Nocardia sp. XZ_19_385 TaxID=2769488 RepID=UPI00188F185B|nr:hypothetical protein [Nocardia sp. XZ_19_385]